MQHLNVEARAKAQVEAKAEITRKYPTEEKYGMTSDMRRSANSVVHNVAEGFGRFEKN